MVRWLWPICVGLLALAACDGSSAGGRADDGAGGVPIGTEPDANFGGEGGVPVALSFVTWEVRSALWTANLSEAPTLPAYTLFLDEEVGACDAADALRFGPVPHRFAVSVAEPAVGDCPMDPQRTGGCRIAVVFEPGWGRGIGIWELPAAEATLRIDGFDAGVLRGELRARFPVEPESPAGGGASTTGESWQYCIGATGLVRECAREEPGRDCCNEGKPLEEVVIPFNAGFCLEASWCREPTFCDAVAGAAACAGPEGDCEAACAAWAESCGSCSNCGGDPRCEEWVRADCERSIAACPAECAAGRGQPLAATAFTCLAAGATCETWISCLSTCGGDR